MMNKESESPRWINEPIGGIVVEQRELTEEQKQRVKEIEIERANRKKEKNE